MSAWARVSTAVFSSPVAASASACSAAISMTLPVRP